MYRQSPSRNVRSKGIRVKHVLQICLLLAVCFWLIYQVKHSHDKKKEFDESDAKALLKGNSDEFIKLGRKDIQSRSDGTISKNEKHDEPIEDEETNEEEKPETEIDGEEDILNDDAKEREDSDENETRETDSEDDGHVQMENIDKITHEAREEHYKADDASSAVTHDEHIETTESENENSNEHSVSILENEKTEDNAEEMNKGEDRKDLETEMAKVGNFSTVRSETKGIIHDSENGSSLNNTIPEGYIGNLTSNETAEVKMVNEDLSLENVTDSKPVPEGISGNSTLNVDNNRIGSNSTGSPENKDAIFDEFSNSSNITVSSESNKITEENNEEIENENSDSTESTMIENPEEDSIDISDSSISLMEKDARVDLDTLPEIQTDGDDTAAE